MLHALHKKCDPFVKMGEHVVLIQIIGVAYKLKDISWKKLQKWDIPYTCYTIHLNVFSELSLYATKYLSWKYGLMRNSKFHIFKKARLSMLYSDRFKENIHI